MLDPLQGVTEAELSVIVLDKVEQTGNVVTTFSPVEVNSEHDFKALGLASFYDTNEDKNVDWEEITTKQINYFTKGNSL